MTAHASEARPSETRPTEHPLRVAAVDRLTDDAVVVEFEVPDELAAAYRYKPGQHVAVRTDHAGDDARRVYSLCDPPAPDGTGQRRLRIGVKQLPNGGFSGYAADARPGDLVHVLTPAGRFRLVPDPSGSRHIGCVAAGSGITPILAIVGAALDIEPDTTVTLVYGNRTAASVMFVEELADLKDRYPARFRLVHVLSREHSGVPALDGRIDGPKLAALVDPRTVDEWFLCGPREMVAELRSGLVERGVPSTRVHSELFFAGPTGAGTVAGTPTTGEERGEGEVTRVTAVLDGRRSVFTLPRDGPPVLEGMLGVRSDAPFACRGGVCGTCRAKVLSGAVRMDQCYALEPEEVDRGFVLTCQSHPTTEHLVVDYDAI